MVLNSLKIRSEIWRRFVISLFTCKFSLKVNTTEVFYRICTNFALNISSTQNLGPKLQNAEKTEYRIQFALTKDKWFYESCELGNIRFWFHFFVKFWKTFQIYSDLNPLTTNVTIIQRPVRFYLMGT